MSKECFANEGWEDYLFWQAHDKKILKKINHLLKSIERDGAMEGEGKPEKLRHRINTYSRRVDDSNRLVYEVSEGMTIVKACKGHYDD